MNNIRKIESWVSWGVFTLLLITYWSTVAPTVSYWDCPEYVSAAWLLEVGHPPGNPVWMLVERMVTLFIPDGKYAALAVNLSSGLFTAFAGFFLSKVIFNVAIWILKVRRVSPVRPELLAAGGAIIGSLAFGWCDSVWFSAVEAEVYALSLFMTALCLWLMVKWAYTPSRPAAWRLLILIAYIFGLSIGVHQLNLLLIPALALIWAFKRSVRKITSLLLIEILSLGAVGCILMGMMPSTIALAAQFELFAVNVLHLPFLSGVAAYVGILAVSLLLALTVTARSHNRGAMAAALFPALFLSGIFIIGGNFMIGAAISAIAAILLVKADNFHARRLNLCVWMLAMLLAGYSSYAIIPIRGGIPSPANGSRPGEPFSFATYQSREQYGSKPLLYGKTPLSRPIYQEIRDSVSGNYRYSKYLLTEGKPVIIPNRTKGCYEEVGRTRRAVLTPELNMWFPRITESSPFDIESYDAWIGMNPSTMKKVKISEAVDSLGKPVNKADASGNRAVVESYRPTYLQNAQWLAGYQVGYMYARYLMWNFSGRQNDIPSQGEVQHGNFITGFEWLDDAMLGAQESLPPYAGKDNPGRNVYWMLPLLLGGIGFLWMFRAGRRGKGACGIVAVMFIMTGVAIVIYLNQGPGEARERDYSFLGSWMAFAIWIGFGAIGLARLARHWWPMLIALAVVVWMGVENYDDHDRSGRYAASRIPANIISSVEPNAIIFVDGDNGTFPLWYSQEVEGYRPDVRIVNLSYLTLPTYSEMMSHKWRDSAPLRLSISSDSLIHNGYSMVRLGNRPDTLSVDEVLRRAREKHTINASYARIPLPSGDSAVISLRTLSRNGSTLERQRLMILDIVASNAASEHQRPIYWLRNLPSSARMAGDSVTSMWLYGYRFGHFSDSETDSMLIKGVSMVGAPNDPGRHVYLDKTPGAQVNAHRTALVFAAEKLLNDGEWQQSLVALEKADRLMGSHPYTYGAMRRGDSISYVRDELGILMERMADTIRLHSDGDHYLMRRATELDARAKMHYKLAAEKRDAWMRYRKALPPRLRSKMAPVF